MRLSALDIVLLPRRAHRFGDEHYGAWFLHAKGSGVWYNIGKSITFADHGDAYNHFNAHDNEAMCRAAAAAWSEGVRNASRRTGGRCGGGKRSCSCCCGGGRCSCCGCAALGH